MEAAGTSQVTVSTLDGVATITLNRPDKLNALTRPMIADIVSLLGELDRDDEVRAVIFTGAGRAFCAGADLSGGEATFDYSKRIENGSGDDLPEDDRDWGGWLALRIFSFLKPVIAAVRGPAVGIGATMQLPMDIRIASSDARFGFVFARRGIAPEAASTWFLPRLVGISTALEWAYSGRLVDAEEAKRSGLVRSVHEPATLLDDAHELALALTRESAPVSIALVRQLMWRNLTADHPMVAHRAESRAVSARGRSADAREGVTAFVEKREARFTNRVSSDLPDIFPDWREPDFK
jgi:enoyl-CoA hydratase/carnithine racemase